MTGATMRLGARRVLLGSACALAIAPAAQAAEPTLIGGQLRAPAGFAPFSAGNGPTGTATVFVDTTDDTAARRGTVRSVKVQRLDGGAFEVTLPVTTALRRRAARSDGWVDFVLQIRSTAGESLYPFSRRLSAKGTWEAGDTITANAKVPLLPNLPGRTAPTAFAAQAPKVAECEWVQSRPYYRYTRVGQLHQWDGFESTFSYATGATADSSIGTAIARGSGNLTASGSRHVSNSSSSEHGSVIRPNRKRFSRYVSTRFSFYTFEYRGKDCTSKLKVLRPGRHIGGSYYKDHNDAAEIIDGRCHKIGGQQQLIVAPGSTEYTQGGEAEVVEQAVSLLGVTLSSQSGWSKHVRTEWHNTTKQPRAICSLVGDPNTAPVTYVGGRVK